MSEVETLKQQLAQVKRDYTAFCDTVRSQAGTISAQCAVSPNRAGVSALQLCTLAASHKQGMLMEAEQAGGYDLAALSVNPNTPSNSETGWERKD